MSLEGKTLKVCSCNHTMQLDAKALAAALKSGEPLTVHHELCRKDAGAFQAAVGGSDDVIVACTQEAALFSELSEKPIRFVNVRELAGWSSEKSTPKIAALIAMAALPEPEPAPAVEFKSQGQVLIIGPGEAALVPAPQGPHLVVAEDKEAFLNRWSRLKKEQAEPVEKKEEKPAPALPPVEDLTPESDFSGFMHPKVEDALRRVALKKLFSDPHFNLPDPFEAYSGDWTGGEPIPEEMLATLNQAQRLLFSEKKEEKEAKEEASTEENPKADEPGRQDT